MRHHASPIENLNTVQRLPIKHAQRKMGTLLWNYMGTQIGSAAGLMQVIPLNPKVIVRPMMVYVCVVANGCSGWSLIIVVGAHQFSRK